MMSFRDKFIEILEGSISLKLYMKKLFCIILLLSIFTGVIFAQSIPKFGEAVLSSNKEKAKSLMRENGFNNVGLTTIRCKELDNALCDVISGSSKWCQMCHIYFEKD